jgi:hypothetical protein
MEQKFFFPPSKNTEKTAPREQHPNHSEHSRIHRFKHSIRRLINKFTTQTTDPLFHLKVWFNYKERNHQICVMKDRVSVVRQEKQKLALSNKMNRNFRREICQETSNYLFGILQFKTYYEEIKFW